jgi:hypothetical protein|tara:strand:- start:33 stop:455 length:423 start_codon:yes stop_codon:yes gene_type:complete
MKTIIKIFPLVTFFIFWSCASQENKVTSEMTITYKAQTRGSIYTIKVEGDDLKFKNQNEEKKLTLSKKQLLKLQKEVSEIELNDIENLQAPSEKRYTDGAMFASFTIQLAETVYRSSEFDHNNPPKDLRNLYTYMLSLIE